MEKMTATMLWTVLCLISLTGRKAGHRVFDESDCPPDGYWLFGQILTVLSKYA